MRPSTALSDRMRGWLWQSAHDRHGVRGVRSAKPGSCQRDGPDHPHPGPRGAWVTPSPALSSGPRCCARRTS